MTNFFKHLNSPVNNPVNKPVNNPVHNPVNIPTPTVDELNDSQVVTLISSPPDCNSNTTSYECQMTEKLKVKPSSLRGYGQ